jgi:hypothetical protein
VQRCLKAIVIATLCLTGCQAAHKNPGPASEIVGAWLVTIPHVPFPLHMFVFHADGTVEQSNPDAGDPNTSDTFQGTASASFFDPNGRQLKGPIQVGMTGERVMP